MQDKTTLGVSDELRQFIKEMVEEVVLKRKSFETFRKYLPRICESEGIDYISLETHLIGLFEAADELKAHESKAAERLLGLLAIDCFLSDDEMSKLISDINNKRNERNLHDNFIHCFVNATRQFRKGLPNDGHNLHAGMKVLMFGWKYPLHVLSGLATANDGIFKDLHTQGKLDITLCLPKPCSDEDISVCRIVPMCAVPIVWRDVLYDYVKRRIGNIMNPDYYYLFRDHIFADFTYLSVNDLGCMEFKGEYHDNLQEEINNYSIIAGVVARAEEFDIIHAHDWHTYPAGIHTKTVSGKPLCIYVQTTEFDRSCGKVSPLVFNIEKDGMDNADCIMCLSELTRQTVINYYHQDPRKCFTVQKLY